MTRLRDLYDRTVAGPEYPPDAADLVDVRLFGLRVPLRASIAVLAATALIVVDQMGLLLSPTTGAELGGGLRGVSVERFVLFLIVPAAIVQLGFRDEVSRYGLRLGECVIRRRHRHFSRMRSQQVKAERRVTVIGGIHR